MILWHVPPHAPKNYLFCDEGLTAVSPKLRGRPDIAGYQVIYTWKQLEPEKDRYDFSGIEQDLALARREHKKLFVQVQDRFFSPEARNLPTYILTDPQYEGGLAPQIDQPGEGVPKANGWVAMQWVPSVRLRFQKLLKALGEKLDGRIEGINLPETSADVTPSTTKGFTNDAYFSAELENAEVAKRAFHHSAVVQYINFWPGEWDNDHRYMERAFQFAIKRHIGIGGPDVVPYRKGQMKNSYPFFHRYKAKIGLVAMAVQQPTLTYKNPATGKPFTKEEFVDFGENYLGVDIIFWATTSPWLAK